MKKYSQNDEDLHIVNYFGEFKGNLLSVGENNGKTLSNSLRLIELGWKATLVEPSPTSFNELFTLHKENKNVKLVNCAIGTEDGKCILHESGAHFADNSDYALLSTIKQPEAKWQGVTFKDVEVVLSTYKTFLKNLDYWHGVEEFDFITIDAEGVDVDILKQIDLTNTKLLCIEWNSIESVKQEILEYTSKFGMTNIIYQSAENLLIAR